MLYRLIEGLTRLINLIKGGNAPTTASPKPEIITAALPCKWSKFCCCTDTAKNIDTEVGGAIIKGKSVTKLPTIHPIAHVAHVAIIEAVSS